jgi:hypothetical protein
MATKVFISWSGDLSRKLGEALREWLPAALQYVKPYFSPEDIEKGTKWNTEIAKELESSDIGVICLTLDNTEKPWILFEAGALSKSIDRSRVCTLLFGIEPADVKGPLTSFQSTRFARDDFKRLITTVNNAAGDAKLDAAVMDSVFEMWWPKLEAKVKEILGSHDRHGEGKRRSERDMLEEVLELTRMNVSRQSRTPRVRDTLIVELVETLDEMMFIMKRLGPDNRSYELIRRLERPLRQLCMEVGIPEIYERHRRHVPPLARSKEDRELLPDDGKEKDNE